MKRLLLVVVLIICTIAIGGSAALAQASVARVKIATPADFVPQYDTLSKITATPYDASGKSLTSTTIQWATHPFGIVRVIVASSTGQAARLEGLVPGKAWVLATANKNTALARKDSVLVRVTRPGVAVLTTFVGATTFTRDLSSAGLALPNVGSHVCVYFLARDKRGGILTGRRVNWTSSDPTVASTERYGECPDTTVDPVRVGAPPS